ncbi:MAG: M3 family oligoendopeptidase [Treponema sp.]|nr:M3 family oligoendopeptidase [Treponema sp.]
MEKDWTWSLKELYEGFDSPAFKKDMEEAAKEIARIKAWAAENFASRDNAQSKIEEFIRALQGMEKFQKIGSFCHLSISTNSEDAIAIKNQDVFQQMITEMSLPQVMFEKFVAETADLDSMIEKSALLKEHSFYLKEIQADAKYMLSEKEEALLAKMRNTGSTAWNKSKEQLTSTMEVIVLIDGKEQTMSLSMARNLAREEKAEVREAAYKAELASYKQVDKAVASALNAIKGEVITVAKLRGYSSPLEMTVKQSRMDMETLNAMLSAMKDFLPVFHKYYRKKAEILGYQNGLPWHGILAPVGSVSMKFTVEEAADFIVKNFNDFNEELGKFAREAFDNRWLDIFPRHGKRGGAFCSGVPQLRQCRILSNFDGSFDAMLTLAHELGHGYHGRCLKDASYLNMRYPMPLAETASTFCETLVARAALKTATPEEAYVIRENDIAGNSAIIVDIYSRFLFEDELFRRRENGSLSVNELNELMVESQKQAYGDGLDHNQLNPGMWINKPHYYYAARNYYNFPYAYGQLFALGLYAIYLQEGNSFLPKYKSLLAATGMNNVADVGKLVGINVREKAFWVQSLKVIEDEIKEFIK